MTERAQPHPSGLLKYAVAWIWLAPWMFLVAHLHTFWTLSPEYQYGWCVPPMALYLLFRRWPSLVQADSAIVDSASPGGRLAARLAGVCALLLLPLWWIRGATPDWSAVSYGLAALVAIYTLCLWAWRKNWAFAWELAFPVCFILCAVPWPQRFETFVIQSLTRIIAAGTVETLQWLGIGAVQMGNLVSLSSGTIGISEACSGVRSIQSMIVATLCLGEIYRLKWTRRLGLSVSGLLLAMGLNLLRNVTLSLIGATYGIEALERWHDSAGWTILFISLPPLFFLARRWRAEEPTAEEGEPAAMATGRAFPRWAVTTLALWFMGVAAGVEAWYRVHEWNARPTQKLAVHWPEERPHFTEIPVADHTRDVLLCTDIRSVGWTESDGSTWTMTSARWAPRQTSAQSARVHRPEVCLQATGSRYIGTQPNVRLEIPGGALAFDPIEMRWGNEPVYYFYCLYEEANRDVRNDAALTRWNRIRRAFYGQRNLGQQTVEVGVRGYRDYASAREAAVKEMPGLLSLQAGGK